MFSRKYLSPLVFAKLQQPNTGRVSIMALFNYVMRKTWLQQTRIGLTLYDVTGQGFLRESVNSNFIVISIYIVRYYSPFLLSITFLI